MAGASITLQVNGLDALLTKLDAFGRIEFHELLDGLARMGQQQTQRRIEVEKTSPEGEAWKKTLDGRAPLFVTGAHLYRSIDHRATSTQAIWGSGWIGARVHQFGAIITPVKASRLAFHLFGRQVFASKSVIPARPYLGVSSENAADLGAAAFKFIERYW